MKSQVLTERESSKQSADPSSLPNVPAASGFWPAQPWGQPLCFCIFTAVPLSPGPALCLPSHSSCFPSTELEPPDLQPPLSPKRHRTLRQKMVTFANNIGPHFLHISTNKNIRFWLHLYRVTEIRTMKAFCQILIKTTFTFTIPLFVVVQMKFYWFLNAKSSRPPVRETSL